MTHQFFLLSWNPQLFLCVPTQRRFLDVSEKDQGGKWRNVCSGDLLQGLKGRKRIAQN